MLKAILLTFSSSLKRTNNKPCTWLLLRILMATICHLVNCLFYISIWWWREYETKLFFWGGIIKVTWVYRKWGIIVSEDSIKSWGQLPRGNWWFVIIWELIFIRGQNDNSAMFYKGETTQFYVSLLSLSYGKEFSDDLYGETEDLLVFCRVDEWDTEIGYEVYSVVTGG